MTGQRFTTWQIYEAIEPFGERADYWRAGQICAQIFNSNRTKKSDPIAKAEDYMPGTFSSDYGKDSAPVDEFAELKRKHDFARGKKP